MLEQVRSNGTGASVGAASDPGWSASKPLTISLVVCFLNEEKHLPSLLASLAAQTRVPDELLLVDDGSTDASPRIAREFAAATPWARVLTRPPRPAERDRLAAAGELGAFQWAVRQSSVDWDVVAKLDADIHFNPGLVEMIERRMTADASLGIAGTYLAVEDERGGRVRETCPPEHVRGATKFYRRRCWAAIDPLPQILGWDTIDEIAARMYGWATASFATAGGDSLHLRPTSSRDGVLRGHRRRGACAWGYGAHPLHVLLGAVRRAVSRPWLAGGASYLLGWAGAGLQRAPRAPQPVRAFGRREQLRRMREALTPWTGR